MLKVSRALLVIFVVVSIPACGMDAADLTSCRPAGEWTIGLAALEGGGCEQAWLSGEFEVGMVGTEEVVLSKWWTDGSEVRAPFAASMCSVDGVTADGGSFAFYFQGDGLWGSYSKSASSLDAACDARVVGTRRVSNEVAPLR